MNSLSLSKLIANLRSATGELRQDGKGRILVAVSAGWFLTLGVRFVYPALLPFLREAFAMDLTTAGMLLTMLWAAYAVGQFPGGIFGDRMGERNALVLSTVVAALALLAVAASVSVWTLFLGTLAFGLATSLFGPARFTIFTRFYPKRGGAAIGITMAAGSIGNTLLPPLAGVLASYVTWRLGFGFVIPLFLGVALALWHTIPGRTSGSNRSSASLSLGTVRDVVRESMRAGIGVINNTYIADALPDNLRNAGLGLLRTNWILIGTLSPLAVGAFADHGYFEEAYLFLALLAGIGAVLTFFILDHTGIESRSKMRTED